MAAKSSCCPSPPIRNLRYSLLRGRPPSNQTSDPTVSRPCVVGDVDADEAPRHPLQARGRGPARRPDPRPVPRSRTTRCAGSRAGAARSAPPASSQRCSDAALGQRPVGARLQLGQQVQLGRRERQHHPQRPRLGREVVAHQERIRGSRRPPRPRRSRGSGAPGPRTFPSRTRSRTPTASSPSRAKPITSASPLPTISTAEGSSSFSSQRSVSRCSLARSKSSRSAAAAISSRTRSRTSCGPALQEGEHLLDHRPVVVLGLPADAGGLAATDVVVEAGPLAALPRDVVGAAAHGVDPAHDRQRAPQLRHVGEGAEVPGARSCRGGGSPARAGMALPIVTAMDG